uniref:Putative secreted protein n=1 Tax=Xenopsylla cheopis TaxID=163159 RepID=A0A6M2DVJ6_XENCH
MSLSLNFNFVFVLHIIYINTAKIYKHMNQHENNNIRIIAKYDYITIANLMERSRRQNDIKIFYKYRIPYFVL